MITPFTFQTADEIAFGRDVSKRALEALAGHAKHVLVIRGSRPEAASWLINGLQNLGLTVTETACSNEPTLQDVLKTTDLAISSGCEAVVSCGGGSVIDLGKAVAGLAEAPRPAMDYLEIVGSGQPLGGPGLYFAAIPTTAGTGAEVTKNAVIGLPDHQRKVSLRSPYLFPNLALVDPALTDGSPKHVTLSSGLDAVTQVIEAYVSCKASPLTDTMCMSALQNGLSALIALANTESESARDAIAYTSLVGGLALANAGLGAVHGLAGVIGGRTNAPHGEICAALLPHVIEQNALFVPDGSPAGRKLEEVKVAIASSLGVSLSDGCKYLLKWMHDNGLRDLSTMGVQPADVSAIALLAVDASSSKGNPVLLGQAEFEQILEREFGGTSAFD